MQTTLAINPRKRKRRKNSRKKLSSWQKLVKKYGVIGAKKHYKKNSWTGHKKAHSIAAKKGHRKRRRNPTLATVLPNTRGVPLSGPIYRPSFHRTKSGYRSATLKETASAKAIKSELKKIREALGYAGAKKRWGGKKKKSSRKSYKRAANPIMLNPLNQWYGASIAHKKAAKKGWKKRKYMRKRNPAVGDAMKSFGWIFGSMLGARVLGNVVDQYAISKIPVDAIQKNGDIIAHLLVTIGFYSPIFLKKGPKIIASRKVEIAAGASINLVEKLIAKYLPEGRAKALLSQDMPPAMVILPEDNMQGYTYDEDMNGYTYDEDMNGYTYDEDMGSVNDMDTNDFDEGAETEYDTEAE